MLYRSEITWRGLWRKWLFGLAAYILLFTVFQLLPTNWQDWLKNVFSVANLKQTNVFLSKCGFYVTAFMLFLSLSLLILAPCERLILRIVEPEKIFLKKIFLAASILISISASWIIVSTPFAQNLIQKIVDFHFFT